jgi:dipeptidyl aminopeptidase/acylaminoacyl peptidase
MTNLGSRGLLLLVLLLFPSWDAAADSVPLDPAGWPIQRELLPHSRDPAKAVELFWAKPEGNGPFPAILFIHGHQEPSRPGGSVYAKTGRLTLMAKRGFVAAAMSQPGYGNSAGPPDFCGPFTQQAAFAALDFLRRETFIKPGKVALFGYSRGAIVAAMVATQDSALATVVLGAGAYDFFAWHPTIPGIARNIAEEAGTSPEAYLARSALYHAQTIKAPVLLLHGGADERIPVQQTEAFAEQLRSVGVTYRVKIFPAAPHGIPIDEQWREVDPFLEQYLR